MRTSAVLVACLLLLHNYVAAQPVSTVLEDRTWYVRGAMDPADPQGNKVVRFDVTVTSASGSLEALIAGTRASVSVNFNSTAPRAFMSAGTMALLYAPASGVQPSFNLTLTDRYLGNTVLELSKHAYDLTRAREHLAYDLLLSTPNLVGAIKKLVRLYINGADYGLFTYTEAPNANWLTKHGLEGGMLYAATSFSFNADPNLVSTASPVYSASKFNAVLTPKTTITDGHASLLAMITAVQNASLSTVDVVAQYFDEANLLTFLATEALLSNSDCVIRNYLLYKPASAGSKWFLFPYNFEAAFNFYSHDLQAVFTRYKPRWFEGVGSLYSNLLFSRVLSTPYFVGRLIGTANQLKAAAYNAANARAVLAKYRDGMFENIFSSVDQNRLPQASPFLFANGTTAAEARREWEAAFYGLADDLTVSYDNLVTSLHFPRPGWTMLSYTRSNSVMTFTWDPFVQPYMCAVTLDLEFYSNPAMTQLVTAARELTGTSVDIVASLLQPNTTYFYRFVLRASSSTNHWTESFASDYTEPDPTNAGYTLRYRGVFTLKTAATIPAATGYSTSDAPAITQFVERNGVKYATLDNVAPATATVGCQTAFLRMPAGWTRAPNDANVKAALKALNLPFGSACVVLADGTSVLSKTGAPCVAGDPVVHNYLYDGGASVGVSPKWCPMRVLLVSSASKSTACKNDGVIGLYATRGAAAPSPFLTYNNFTDLRANGTDSGVPPPDSIVDVQPGSTTPMISLQGGSAPTEGGVARDGGYIQFRVNGGVNIAPNVTCDAQPDLPMVPQNAVSLTDAMLTADYTVAAPTVVSGTVMTSGTDALRTINSGGDMFITGTLRAGSLGSARQALLIKCSTTIYISGTIDASGDAGAGQAGGAISLQAVRIVLLPSGRILTQGGRGDLAGNAGDVSFKASQLVTLMGTVNATGGSAALSQWAARGGKGGNLNFQVNANSFIGGAVVARGGAASSLDADASAGGAGNLTLNSDGNVTVCGAIDLSGGNAAAVAPGGTVVSGGAGQILLGTSAPPWNFEASVPISFEGGLGYKAGGNGGSFLMNNRRLNFYARLPINLNGGASAVKPGNGGQILGGPGPNATGYAGAGFETSAEITLIGGSVLPGFTAPGGNGGLVKLSTQSTAGGNNITETGLISVDGGMSGGTGRAGNAGTIYLMSNDGSCYTWGRLHARGGNARDAGGKGGDGGLIYTFTDQNHGGRDGYNVVYETGVYDASGGNGTGGGGNARNNGGQGVAIWPVVWYDQYDVRQIAVLFNSDGVSGPSSGWLDNKGKIIARGGVPNGWGGDVCFHGRAPVKGNVDPYRGYVDTSGDGTGESGSWAAL